MPQPTDPDRLDSLTRIGGDLRRSLTRARADRIRALVAARTDDERAAADNAAASAVDLILVAARDSLDAAGLLDGVRAWAARMAAVEAVLHATKREADYAVEEDVATAKDHTADAAYRLDCAADALESEPELPFGYDSYARLPLGEAA